MSKYAELLERVKAATGPDRELDWAIKSVEGVTVIPWSGLSGQDGNWVRIFSGKVHDIGSHRDSGSSGSDRYLPRFTGDIDAALALFERLLPGWFCSVSNWNSATIQQFSKEAVYPQEHHSAATPPLAILAALLTALEAADLSRESATKRNEAKK